MYDFGPDLLSEYGTEKRLLANRNPQDLGGIRLLTDGAKWVTGTTGYVSQACMLGPDRNGPYHLAPRLAVNNIKTDAVESNALRFRHSYILVPLVREHCYATTHQRLLNRGLLVLTTTSLF